MMRAMEELRQTRRQFWMPALLAAFLIFGLPILYTVGFLIYWWLIGWHGDYNPG